MVSVEHLINPKSLGHQQSANIPGGTWQRVETWAPKHESPSLQGS